MNIYLFIYGVYNILDSLIYKKTLQFQIVTFIVVIIETDSGKKNEQTLYACYMNEHVTIFGTDEIYELSIKIHVSTLKQQLRTLASLKYEGKLVDWCQVAAI